MAFFSRKKAVDGSGLGYIHPVSAVAAEGWISALITPEGKMIREIALVSENPQAYAGLIERLRASGVQVFVKPSLTETLPLFDEDTGTSAVALILDSPRHYDSGLLGEVFDRHPQLPLLVFDSRRGPGPDSWVRRNSELFRNLPGPEQRGREWFGRYPGVHAFSQSLGDPDAFRLIEAALKTYPVQPLVSHPDGDDSMESATAQLLCSPPALPISLAGQDNASEEIVGCPTDGAKNTFVYTEDFLRRVGSSNVPVLLHGETGSGKEVLARRLWSYSDRAGKPFFKLNCAALPSELIESELFGYEKGAFTGATMDKPGKFELAQNGTILLDEIGDMDIRLQAKLLQVLQDGEVQPLGSSRVVSVNVRVMAATHRDLRLAISQGSFREDLYYRLNVINLTVPPLRERQQEILSLAKLLLLRHLPQGAQPPSITDPLRRAMLAYHWPGNVRELENAMRRFLVYQSAELLAEELRDAALSVKRTGTDKSASNENSAGDSSNGNSKVDYLAHASREAESKLLLETLDAVRWNRRQAAERLNIDYKAFLYKLQKHGIVEGKAKARDFGA